MNLEAAPNPEAAPAPARLIRFDGFEADLQSGELRKGDARLKLSEQPFSVLAILLARPGEVVTRDELQKQLWPADTFVDFERGLNKAMNRLRDALGDSASRPRYIETLPKRGYRFIAPLDRSAPVTRVPEEPAVSVPLQPAPAGFRPKGSWPRRRLLITGAAVLAVVLAAATLSLWRSGASNGPEGTVPDPVLRSSLVPPG